MSLVVDCLQKQEILQTVKLSPFNPLNPMVSHSNLLSPSVVYCSLLPQATLYAVFLCMQSAEEAFAGL